MYSDSILTLLSRTDQVPPGFASNSSAASPRADGSSSVGEYVERLNISNNVCNALQTQVNNLQGNQ